MASAGPGGEMFTVVGPAERGLVPNDAVWREHPFADCFLSREDEEFAGGSDSSSCIVHENSEAQVVKRTQGTAEIHTTQEQGEDARTNCGDHQVVLTRPGSPSHDRTNSS